MSNEIISADEARELTSQHEASIDEIVERCAQVIKANATQGENEIVQSFKKQAVSEEEFEELKRRLTERGYTVETPQSGSETDRYIKVSW